jgi:hypothetical protein
VRPGIFRLKSVPVHARVLRYDDEVSTTVVDGLEVVLAVVCASAHLTCRAVLLRERAFETWHASLRALDCRVARHGSTVAVDVPPHTRLADAVAILRGAERARVLRLEELPTASPEPTLSQELRRCGLAFGSGAMLAFVTSAGIAGVRLTRGDTQVALVANGVTSCASLLTLVAAMTCVALTARVRAPRPRLSAVLIAQALGAAVGIATVHAWLHDRVGGTSRWLSESPAQFVNDGVALVATLAAVWACAHRTLQPAVLVAGAGVVTFYCATAAQWHVDAFTVAARAVSVQELVAAQFFGVGLALVLFRWLVLRGSDLPA